MLVVQPDADAVGHAATTASALGNVLNPVNFANVAGVTLSLGANTEVGSISGAGGTGGTITLGANTLTFGGNGQNTTYAGTITGTGGINFAAGTVLLSGSLANTGANIISSGATLQIGDGTPPLPHGHDRTLKSGGHDGMITG